MGKRFKRKALRKACRAWLELKYEHLINPKPVLYDLQGAEGAWHETLLEKSLTLIRNEGPLVPIQGLEKKNPVLLSLQNRRVTSFFKSRLNDYLEMPQYLSLATSTKKPPLDKLFEARPLIVALHAGRGPYLPFTPTQRALIDTLTTSHKEVIFVFFGAAELLATLEEVGGRPTSSAALLLAHENSRIAQDLATQALFGGRALHGQLTVRCGPYLPGMATYSQENGSLSFASPAWLALHAPMLMPSVEEIIEEGLRVEAFPGCQLLVAKDGQVLLNKSYGYHTYAMKRPVSNNSIYDLASLTKVMGVATSLMRLYDERLFDPKARLKDYLPYWKRNEKGALDFESMLAHHSGLYPWIPYHKSAYKKNGKRKRRYLSKRSSRRYGIQLSDKLHLRSNFVKRVIYKQIEESELAPRGYTYSGLAFYLLPELITRRSGIPYRDYLKRHFYTPLGASTLDFLPKERFGLQRIVPTERDNFFRMQLLHGTVHDEGAAMMGGISGNAGLFAKSIDVAKVFQMYLQGGYYGGRRYVSAESLERFTACQFCEEDNRRGLGFDRPPLVYQAGQSSVAPQASERSYGHTGFTGTIAWADETHGLLFVFLCNRVYPSRDNKEIYLKDIRPRIHQAIYHALCIPHRHLDDTKETNPRDPISPPIIDD